MRKTLVLLALILVIISTGCNSKKEKLYSFKGVVTDCEEESMLVKPNKDEDIFSDFINTSSIGVFYEDTFKKYDITHIICNKSSKMNMIITKTNDTRYKELYSDDHFVIYERLNVNE